jgi:hypothetical protein
LKEYAVYKGDEFICVGTVKECAERLGIKPDTVYYYTSPKYKKIMEKGKNPQNYIIVIKLEEDEDVLS